MNEEEAERLGELASKIAEKVKTVLIEEIEAKMDKEHFMSTCNFVSAEMLAAALDATNRQIELGMGEREGKAFASLIINGVIPSFGRMLELLGVGGVAVVPTSGGGSERTFKPN